MLHGLFPFVSKADLPFCISKSLKQRAHLLQYTIGHGFMHLAALAQLLILASLFCQFVQREQDPGRKIFYIANKCAIISKVVGFFKKYFINDLERAASRNC